MRGSRVRRGSAARLLLLLLLSAVQACGVLPQTGPPGQDLYIRRR